MLRLNRTGDTIVEVMVVLAILGMAIGISYATATSSLLANRAAQENSEATLLIQSQIEQLRNFVSADSGFFDTQPSPVIFCFTSSGSYVPISSQVNLTTLSQYLSDYTHYPTGCGLVNGLYNVSITRTSVDPASGALVDKFTGKIVWDNVQGHGQDSTTLVYRIHP
jgi:type II secretory pathway pseudopilin PulG